MQKLCGNWPGSATTEIDASGSAPSTSIVRRTSSVGRPGAGLSSHGGVAGRGTRSIPPLRCRAATAR